MTLTLTNEEFKQFKSSLEKTEADTKTMEFKNYIHDKDNDDEFCFET